MDVVYVFFENENIRIPFYNYDKELFNQLAKSNMGHWENSNQQFTISSSKYDHEKMKTIIGDKPFVEVGKEPDKPLIVNWFVTGGQPAPEEKESAGGVNTGGVNTGSVNTGSVNTVQETELVQETQNQEGELPDYFPDFWLEKLKTEIGSRKYSPNTRSAYTYHNRLLCEWLKKTPDAVTSDDIKRYLAYLDRVKKQSASTINFSISAFRFLYRQIMKRDTVREQKRPRQDVRLPSVYAKSEIKKILNIKNLKHRMMLMMTYDSGFRVGELVRLKKENIDFERKVIIVHSGKGRKDRKTPISRVVIDTLEEYFEQYKITDWLFPGQDPSKHITVRTAQKIHEQAREKANIDKKATFHSLRHSFATHHLEKGTAIHIIRDFLGHSSVRTTERYTRIANLDISNVPSLLDTLED